MTNLLQSGASWLADQLQANAAQAVTYRRDADSVSVRAALGKQFLRTSDRNGNTKAERHERHFIIRAADLVLSGVTVTPRRGDAIDLTIGGLTERYEVMAEPDGPSGYSDPAKLILRVRTKFKAVALPPPTLIGFTPAAGASGTSVIITGTNFTGATAVNFNVVPAMSFAVVSATQITAIVPVTTTGKITVTTPSGTATSATDFTYLWSPAELSGLLAYHTFLEGSGMVAKNKAVADHTQDNLIYAPEQLFAVKWQDGGGSTATDNGGLTDPNGGANASRVQLASGALNGRKLPVSLATGQYTFSCYVKSNTGGAQKFRLGYTAGTINASADQTATGAWQRFSFTFTAGATVTVLWLFNDVAQEAADVQVWGAKLEAAAAMTAYVSPDYDYLFDSDFHAAPSWSAAGVVLDGATQNNYGLAVPVAHLSLAAFSYFAVLKQTSQGSRVFAFAGDNYQTLSLEGYGNAGAQADHSGGVFNNSADLQQGLWLTDGREHVVGFVADGTNVLTYCDGTEVYRTAQPAGAVSPLYLLLGQGGGGFGWRGTVLYDALYNRGLSLSEVQALTAGMKDNVNQRTGVGVQYIPLFVNFDGDSITTGIYPYTAMQGLATVRQWANDAISGSILGNFGDTPANNSLYGRAAIDDARLAKVTAGVLSIFIGANDISTMTADAWVTKLKAYVAARRAAGWKVLFIFPTDRQDSTYHALWLQVHALVIADTSFVDGYSDVAWTDSRLNPWNNTYYADGTHPNASGQAVIAADVLTKLQALGA